MFVRGNDEGLDNKELPEKFDDALDAAGAHGPQLIRYDGKTVILATKEDYEDHLDGKSVKMDSFLAAIPQDCQ